MKIVFDNNVLISATCIVIGDSDLLVLHPFENILIVTPNYFLEKI